MENKFKIKCEKCDEILSFITDNYAVTFDNKIPSAIAIAECKKCKKKFRLSIPLDINNIKFKEVNLMDNSKNRIETLTKNDKDISESNTVNVKFTNTVREVDKDCVIENITQILDNYKILNEFRDKKHKYVMMMYCDSNLFKEVKLEKYLLDDDILKINDTLIILHMKNKHKNAIEFIAHDTILPSQIDNYFLKIK